MEMNKAMERLFNGLIKENPTFVLMLGMCPTMAVTTSGVNAIGMGLSTTVVLILSNMVISLLRNIIPDKVRIPGFIVIIASFVTVVEMLMKGFLPSLYSALGIYIPLIVVNCIILGRAEAYAYKNAVLPSMFDGIGMGLGFTMGLTCIGIVREILGAGQAFGFQIMPAAYEPITIFILAPGAFFVLSILVAIQNKVRMNHALKTEKTSSSACTSDCSACGNGGCGTSFYEASDVSKSDVKKDDKEEK